MIDLLKIIFILSVVAFVIWCVHDSINDARWAREHHLNDDLAYRLRMTQRALGHLLPHIRWENVSPDTRRTLQQAGIKVRLNQRPCPNTKITEMFCSCDLHGPIENVTVEYEENENDKE